ncbi:GNAT superfamily N-acetyltransferase [Pedobacter sp. UYP30]|uniref:GNAT family N-acetyltransferase n=1 Tax=Pedobacter sp. UYP30 TaxID=1756400 RepID=UPI0033949F20
MRKAIYDDKKRVISILSQSFESNQSVNYIAKQDSRRLARVNALMNYSFEICYRFGAAFLSDDNSACALILYPDKKKTTVKSIILDIKLLINCIGVLNIGKAIDRESKIKKLQPNELMTYLWFIGVDPKFQGLGRGSELMADIIDECEKLERPIYLETSTLLNIPWYKKFGFEVYDELLLTYKLFFLKRNFTRL